MEHDAAFHAFITLELRFRKISAVLEAKQSGHVISIEDITLRVAKNKSLAGVEQKQSKKYKKMPSQIESL